jgi:hypothetical protein
MHYLILSFSIINLLLGVVVLIQTKKEIKNITFLFFSGFASLWTFNNFYLRLNPQVEFLRLSYGLGVLVAFLCLVWVYLFLRDKLSVLIKYIVLPLTLILFLVTTFTDKIVENLYSIEPLGYEGKLGAFFGFYSAFFSIIIFLAIYNLAQSFYFASDKDEKSQIKYVLFGISFFAATSFVVSFLVPLIFHKGESRS